MKAVLSEGDSGYMVDDVYGYNLLCCLDECDETCGLIKKCWLSPHREEQFSLDFQQN